MSNVQSLFTEGCTLEINLNFEIGHPTLDIGLWTLDIGLRQALTRLEQASKRPPINTEIVENTQDEH